MSRAANSITVTGQGTAQAAPDYFTISIGIEAAQPTVPGAYSKASEALTAVHATLLARGVPREALRSSSLDVRADTRWQEDAGSVVTGYTVSSTLTVTLGYDQGAEDIVAAVVDTGSNYVRLQGMTPVVSDPSAAQDAARSAAWADARRAAELYAGLAGRPLGAVSHVSEGSLHEAMPRPVLTRAALVTEGSLPLAPGQSDVTIAVQVTWLLG